jgi:hypothetical protein
MIAPPFTGYFGPRTQPGSWTASKLYPGNGQIVLQMGAQPPNTSGELFAGAGLTIGAPLLAGRFPYTITATVDVGPLTLLPRGGVVAAEIIFGFDRIPGDREEFRPPSPSGVVGARLGLVTLQFTVEEDEIGAGTPLLRCACGLLMQYSGTPNPLPYAEIIATYRSVTIQGTRGGLPESPTELTAFNRWDEKGETLHELKGAEIGSIDGIVPKK